MLIRNMIRCWVLTAVSWGGFCLCNGQDEGSPSYSGGDVLIENEASSASSSGESVDHAASSSEEASSLSPQMAPEPLDPAGATTPEPQELPLPPPAPAAPNPVAKQRPAAPRPPVKKALASPNSPSSSVRSSSGSGSASPGESNTPVAAPASVNAIPEVATTVVTKTEKITIPSASVASPRDIKIFQRADPNEILRRMPGAAVIQNGGPGTLTGVHIRGMQSDQNVVLLNGRRLPPGLAGQYQLEFLDVSTLESVQVLRGAGGSVHGADAIGGVIDLKSTDARFVENNALLTFAEGGSFRTIRSGTAATFREGAVGGVLEGATISTEGDRPFSDFENRNFRGNIAWDAARGAWFDVFGFVQSGSVEVPGSSFQNPLFPENQTNFNDAFLISPRITIERDDWDFQWFYNYNQNDLEAIDTPLFFGFGADNTLRQIGRETESRFTYRGLDRADLTIGGGRYEYHFRQTPIGVNSLVTPESRTFHYNSVFAQADLALPRDIGILASVRHDNHDSFADATTYSLAAEKKFPGTGTALFARVATGYRPPVGQDLLFIVDPAGINPLDLQPEESHSREAGLRQSFFGDAAAMTLTYFENEFTDSIEFDPTTFGISTVDGRVKGWESEAKISLGDGIEFYANYAYLDTEVTGGAGNLSGIPGSRLPRRPRHTVNGGIVLDRERWTLGGEIHGSLDRFDRPAPPSFVDDYTTARIFGSFELNKRAEFQWRIENLFDEDYLYTRGFEAPGFGAFAGLRFIFGR